MPPSLPSAQARRSPAETSRITRDNAVPFCRARPTSLSTALCRPRPPYVQQLALLAEQAAACRPRSGRRPLSRAQPVGEAREQCGFDTDRGVSAMGQRSSYGPRPARLAAQTAGDVVYTFRSSVMSESPRPGGPHVHHVVRVRAVDRRPAQYTMFCRSYALASTPSLTRNPAASAKSSPGVRMVIASGLP